MNNNLNNLAILVVDNVYMINHALNYLYKYNFKKIIILKKKNVKIKKNLSNNFNLKIINFSLNKFSYDILKKKNIRTKLNDKFLILRTSKFLNIDLFKLYRIFLKHKKKLVISISNQNKKLDNTEIFFLSRRMLEKYDFTFNNLYKSTKYKINFVKNDYLKVEKSYNKKKIDQFFSKIYSKSIILDRDGVINVNKGYVGFKKDFIFQLGAIKAIKYFYNNNYNIFVVSNQSGIARGYFKLKDVENLHEYLRRSVIKNSATINKIYFSPYHSDGIIKKYKRKSECRKPGTKLFRILVKEWGIKDTSKFVMIGDQISDQQFAKNAKIKFSFFKNGSLFKLAKKLNLSINKY